MDPKICVQEAKQLRYERKMDESIKLLEKGLKEHPTNVHILNSLIYTCGLRNLTEAKQIFINSIINNMADIVSYTTMLNLYVMYNEKEEAQLLFNNLEYKKMGNSHTYYIMSKFYYMLKEYDKCAKLISKSLTIFPTDIHLNLLYLDCNMKLENYDECLRIIAYYEDLPAEKYQNRIKIVQAQCYQEKGNIQKAIEIFRKVLLESSIDSPEHVRAIYGLIVCNDVKAHEVHQFKTIIKTVINNPKYQEFIHKTLTKLNEMDNSNEVKLFTKKVSVKVKVVTLPRSKLLNS